MTDLKDNEITLEEAARLVKVRRPKHDPTKPIPAWPSARPGAEAHAVLDAMLAAGRKGRTVRQPHP